MTQRYWKRLWAELHSSISLLASPALLLGINNCLSIPRLIPQHSIPSSTGDGELWVRAALSGDKNGWSQFLYNACPACLQESHYVWPSDHQQWPGRGQSPSSLQRRGEQTKTYLTIIITITMWKAMKYSFAGWTVTLANPLAKSIMGVKGKGAKGGEHLAAE